MTKFSLLLLFFITVSIHATLQVNFKVTGPEAKNVKVCLSNRNHFHMAVCGIGYVARNYKESTKQVFYFQTLAHTPRKIVLLCDGTLLEGASENRSTKHIYTPFGRKGTLSFTAQAALENGYLVIRNCKVNDETSG